MEKLLHHLNEELLQNRDQLTDQNEDLKRMTSTLELQKQELDAEKVGIINMVPIVNEGMLYLNIPRVHC